MSFLLLFLLQNLTKLCAQFNNCNCIRCINVSDVSDECEIQRILFNWIAQCSCSFYSLTLFCFIFFLCVCLFYKLQKWNQLILDGIKIQRHRETEKSQIFFNVILNWYFFHLNFHVAIFLLLLLLLLPIPHPHLRLWIHCQNLHIQLTFKNILIHPFSHLGIKCKLTRHI